MNILACTLGASWAVVPEVFGFLAPQRLDLYAHHPDAAAIAALRRQHALAAPDEVWICTTEGAQTTRSLATLDAWWQFIGAPMPLRIWTAAGTDQLASQHECAHIRELTLRVVLAAAERCGPDGQLVLSLAGGRKTMSADLQSAGQMFGAHAWLHVVGPDPLPAEIARDATPARFGAPLPAPLAAAITPLVVGRGTRNELLDIEIDQQRVTAERFPLPLPETSCRWALPPQGATLSAELAHRERASSQLLGNFLAALGASEHHENWRSLYRLPPRIIETLRTTALGPQHEAWLRALPKADLHRHLGGSLELAAQRSVGRAVWNALPTAERDAALAIVAPLLTEQRDQWPWDWPARHVADAHAPRRAARAAALLVHCDDEVLTRNLYDATEPRLALKRSSPHGFSAYERPGELTGSAILGHPAALTPYARALVTQARAEGLAYLELRGSPHKYRADDPGGFLSDLRAALQEAGADVGAGGEPPDGPRIGFLWILDRRQRGNIPSVVTQAVTARAALDNFLLGLDLAGDEGTTAPEDLAPAFVAAFRECLPITIHAGEGEPAERIWQAAYHLHADRIGHGLTLVDHPQLLARFRDRGICIELCPTSNREVVGFHDPSVATSVAHPAYPLRRFMDAGLPVTLCTDNPGLSRTDLTHEFLTAARMTPGGLSQWQALALLRQGFAHAFIGAAERERIMKGVDHRIHASLSPGNP